MPIESIKLSQKKNGKGYISSYSVNISNKEAQACALIGKQIIKIIDSSKNEIVIKAKSFTLTIEMLREIVRLKELEKEESSNIDSKYFANSRIKTMPEMMNRFADEHAGKIARSAYQSLEQYLLSLTVENVADLTLLMYMGRDMDCNMSAPPGEERFLEFFGRYNDLVCGSSKEQLVDILLEKAPLLMYLRMGYRLLTAPVGTSIDSLYHDWNEM